MIRAFAVAALVVLAVVGATVLADRPETDRPLGAVLSAADRAMLNAPAVDRGADPPAADPGVDLVDPEALARAYLEAALSADPEDAGRTRRRAASYAVPGSPPAVGVLVLDPPPTPRTASVRSLELLGADDADRRRAYRAVVDTASGEPRTVTADVVLALQPDGRWLVAADTPENPDLP